MNPCRLVALPCLSSLIEILISKCPQGSLLKNLEKNTNNEDIKYRIVFSMYMLYMQYILYVLSIKTTYMYGTSKTDWEGAQRPVVFDNPIVCINNTNYI